MLTPTSRVRPHVALLHAVLLLAAATTASARRIVPPTIELDGCVLPSSGCAKTADVVRMVVDDREIEFAVETLRPVSTTSASSGKILTELELRPVRVHGPKELTQKLEPGARRRVRALLRTPGPFLLLQAVEPLDEKR